MIWNKLKEIKEGFVRARYQRRLNRATMSYDRCMDLIEMNVSKAASNPVVEAMLFDLSRHEEGLGVINVFGASETSPRMITPKAERATRAETDPENPTAFDSLMLTSTVHTTIYPFPVRIGLYMLSPMIPDTIELWVIVQDAEENDMDNGSDGYCLDGSVIYIEPWDKILLYQELVQNPDLISYEQR